MMPSKFVSKISHHNIKIFAAAFMAALFTILIYIPALQNDFVNWDDPQYIYENHHIQYIDLKFFKWMFTTFHASNWHPLTWLSHAIDYAIWGLNPMGHHLTSVILHGLNTFLVFLLIMKLMESAKAKELPPFTPEQEKQFRTKTIIVSTVTALLFGIHPIHVESVAWISERKDVLYAFFFLLSLLSYLEYSSPSAEKKKPVHYFLCLFFFILSLMSKPMAVTLPVVLIILDFYPLERLQLQTSFTSQRWVIIEKAPFIMLSLVSMVLTILAHKTHGALVPGDIYPFMSRFLLALKALVFYLYKMFLPINLAPLYPYPKKISFFAFDYIGSFIVVTGITFICISLYMKKQNIWAGSWVFYIISSLPVLGIIQIGKHSAADRYTYIPSLGPFILFGIIIAFIWKRLDKKTYSAKRNKILMLSLLTVIFVFLSFLTIKQINIWRNSITLWTSEIRLFPDNYYAYYCRGTAYAGLGQYLPAINDYSRAIELNPGFEKTYNNIALTYRDLKNYSRAIENFNKSIELNPNYAEAYNNRGIVYFELKKYQQALDDYNRAIDLNPLLEEAYNNRGEAFSRLGLYNEALLDYNRAIDLNPQYADAYNNRGIIYLKLKKYRQAIENFNIFTKLRPNIFQTYNNLGIIYGTLGNYEEAVKNFNISLKLNPNAVDVYINRGMLFLELHKENNAIKDFQIAARLGDKQAQDYLKSKGISW
jgi:tetratricopeptide (TPR) repeat protein